MAGRSRGLTADGLPDAGLDAREALRHLSQSCGDAASGRGGAHMSGGEQQMLTVARTLMGNPLLVLLDEPSEGVAPVIVEEMADAIIKVKKEGISVIISKQNIHFAELVCDRAYVLEKGQLQWAGRMADLAQRYAGAAPAPVSVTLPEQPEGALRGERPQGRGLITAASSGGFRVARPFAAWWEQPSAPLARSTQQEPRRSDWRCSRREPVRWRPRQQALAPRQQALAQ